MFQACFGLEARVLPWRRPECITGAGSLQRLPELLADAGCRNTLFNGRAQTGAGFLQDFRRLGLSRFRLELLDDPPEKVRLLVSRYRELLDGSCTAARLIRELDVAEQLGTTEGTLRPG